MKIDQLAWLFEGTGIDWKLYAVLGKQENRWGIGIKALRHMQRMIGVSIFSRDIRDSQAAFKLYHKDILAEILEDPSVYDFSFDSDWIACVIAMEEESAKVPFAFIDSFAYACVFRLIMKQNFCTYPAHLIYTSFLRNRPSLKSTNSYLRHLRLIRGYDRLHSSDFEAPDSMPANSTRSRH